MTTILQQLGPLSVQQFMRDYWQKKPLLIRQAFPQLQQADCRWRLSPDALFELAERDDTESRLITHFRQRWAFERGPFAIENLPTARQKKWTLLVQGVNLYQPQMAELMQAFRFIPDVRLDDVMISYATDGGGVGPHFDSYDVFLLQAQGRREWQISAQTDRALRNDVPLKILSHFTPEQSWILEPGDMLYLPPHYAHNGIAVGECMTYSIGFRAPGMTELVQRFMEFFADSLDEQASQDKRYHDPQEKQTKKPAELPQALIDQFDKQLQQITWNKQILTRFLGQYFSEPKAHVYFETPHQPLSQAQFNKQISRHGASLHDRSVLLYRGKHYFINGETEPADEAHTQQQLAHLANTRQLPATSALSGALLDLLYDWYCAGWLVVNHKK